MAKQYPDETWECSHLGGDRFAPTVIVLPHGLHYGRVPASAACDIIESYLDGRVDPRYLRGRSSLPNAVQAAESFARARFDDNGIDSFRLVEHRHEGGASTVVFDRGGSLVTVNLIETRSVPLLSTCASTVAAPVREFAPVSISD